MKNVASKYEEAGGNTRCRRKQTLFRKCCKLAIEDNYCGIYDKWKRADLKEDFGGIRAWEYAEMNQTNQYK